MKFTSAELPGLDRKWKIYECVAKSREALTQPYYTGKEILSTDGWVMSVFPYSNPDLVPRYLEKPSEEAVFPIDKLEERPELQQKQETHTVSIAFNPTLLMKLCRAIDAKEGIILRLNPNNPRSPVVIDTCSEENRAYGILMPLTNKGGDFRKDRRNLSDLVQVLEKL